MKLRVFPLAVILMMTTLQAKEPPKKRVTVEQLFNVRTVKVKKVDTAKSLQNYGYVVADETRITDVAPRFGGYVERLYADRRFQRVQKGAPLARVYAPKVLQAKEEYLSALRFGTKGSGREMVRSSRARLKLLGVSDDEIEEIAKKGKIDTATTLHAPRSGWIFEKRVHEGGAFKAGERLFRIVALDEVWVEAKIYQKELPTLSRYRSFKIQPDGFTQRFEAKKLLLYPAIDPKEATATLRLSVQNPEGKLLPGMYVRVFASERKRSYLTLPRSAVIRKNGRWYVFRAGDFRGEYEPTQIEAKPLDKDRYMILKGLREGDEVADNALFMLDSDAQMNGLY